MDRIEIIEQRLYKLEDNSQMITRLEERFDNLGKSVDKLAEKMEEMSNSKSNDYKDIIKFIASSIGGAIIMYALAKCGLVL